MSMPHKDKIDVQKYQLSFGTITLIETNIVEVIIDDGIKMSLEMAEEYSNFLGKHFDQPFGILVNKINDYKYGIEAQLILHSDINLKAVAAVEYNKSGKDSTRSIVDKRKVDHLNIKSFSGLDLGRQTALDWLKNELENELEK